MGRRQERIDQQWELNELDLPGREGAPGPNADNRLFVIAVLSVARDGNAWRDLRKRFGNGASARGSSKQLL
ncbi:transposase [Planctomicrobium sp. SH664]|uniref:transposase n=1 Tax=Planctomicrobium sp. SH664 TaxID=3448125 RepID=UPI003F5C055D